MSEMYRQEVPQYGTLVELVAEINERTLGSMPSDGCVGKERPLRLDIERHGAIRVGTAEELSVIRRLFAVMGMQPVGYYDLSVAGVPVHSTAFRPLDFEALEENPFRVFTSLLRLDLIGDSDLRKAAEAVLSSRSIFTSKCVELISRNEANGGLTQAEAEEFVAEALETFRWHGKATVSADLYAALRAAHPLIADIVCFPGPHINHLTPRTLDIDAAQEMMPKRGIQAKAVIEGPPRRACPILLRQTSFLALREPVSFQGLEASDEASGTHTARFGEIEQRGVALTVKGRRLYDSILGSVREAIVPAGDGSNAQAYIETLERAFAAFPDSYEELRREGLAFFRYAAGNGQIPDGEQSIDRLVEAGALRAIPITYEDFLPVSAAGIFQSNLGDGEHEHLAASPNRPAFEHALGASVQDELALYAQCETASLVNALRTLGLETGACL